MKKLFTTLTFCLFAFVISAQTNGKLNVTFTTATANGNYKTENAVAVWVQNSTNQIQKTLLLNSNNEKQSGSGMTVWFTAIGSNWANRSTYKDVDGIAGATNTNYGTKTCYWGNTVNLGTVTDGLFTVKMELLDGHLAPLNSAGHYVAAYTFTKGTTANNGVLSGTLPVCFKNVSIAWAPNLTGINDIELSTLYSIYPNPAISSVYVNGPDIQSVDVFTLEGKRIFSSNQQKLNIAALKKGTYMLSINTGKGNVSKKLIKN